MERPVVPEDVLEEFQLKELSPVKRVVRLIQDAKHTGQFSIKLPKVIVEEIQWVAGDRIEIEIVGNNLHICKIEG